MTFKTVLLLACLSMFSVAFCSTDWPNEPASSTVLTDFPFNAKSGNGWTPQYPGGNIVSDPTAPFSGPNVLEETWRNHNYPDIANIYYSFPAGTSEFYLGLWWKPSNPFYGWQNNGCQKLLLLEGSHTYLFMYRKSGTGASSVYGLSMGPDAGNNNCHVASGVSCDLLYPNVSNPDVVLGQWHRLEYYIRASTTGSSRDGVMRWWMDGTMVGNYTNVNTNARTFSEIRTYHWDMSPDPQVVTDYHRFDHARICKTNGNVANPLFISTSSLPAARANVAYTATLAASGGKSPYSWTITSGGLLPGLSLNKTSGVILGTPTTGGRCDFTVRVLDASIPPLEATKALYIVASGTSAIANGPNNISETTISVKGARGVVHFDLQNAGENRVAINVFDLQGRNVWTRTAASAKEIAAQPIWNHGGNLKKGIYLVHAEQNGKTMKTSFCNIW